MNNYRKLKFWFKLLVSMKVGVHKVPMDAPDDMHGITDLIKNRIINPDEIVAVIAKTEGNGNVNDFTRGFATYSIQSLLSECLNRSRSMISENVSIVCSGGCEGVMSPHATIFTRSKNSRKKAFGEKRLAIGIKNTRDLLPEEIGTSIHAKEVANGVKEAMIDANINEIKDVHFVQIKCPLLTSGGINNAEERGKKVVTKDTLKSMAYSRGASALGVAIAQQEVNEKRVIDSLICNDWNLYSSVASTSAGIELMNNEIIVMGNSDRSSSAYIIGHSVMSDPLDSLAVIEALRNVGLYDDNTTLSRENKQKLVNVFRKSWSTPKWNC
jgi:cyanuric acid amidohydrolase